MPNLSKFFEMRQFLLLPLTFFLLSCKKENEESSSNQFEASEVITLTEAQSEELLKFCNDLATNTSEGDAKAVSRAFNLHEFGRRAVAGYEIPAEDQNQFLSGFAQGINKREGGLGWAMLGQTVEFVRLNTFEEMEVPLFRILIAEGGVEYTYFLIQPNDIGELKIIDTWSLSSGEWASISTRRVVYPMLKSLLGSKWGKIANSAKNKKAEAELELLKSFNEAYASGDTAGIATAYKNLPSKLQKQRYLWVIYLSSLGEDQEAYLAEVDKYAAAFPLDASAAFMMIDAEYMRQNWTGAREKIDIIESKIGADEYLDILRANIHMEEGNHPAVIEMTEKVIKTAPHLEDAWWSLLISLSEMKKHSKIADTLSAYHQQFGIRLTADDINQDIFGAFINSPEGKAYFNSEE